MAEKNSLWKNIRNKAKQNRASGATPKKPTTEMLRQERKIKAQKANGGPVGEDVGGQSVMLTSKSFNDPKTGETRNLQVSDDNQTWINSDDPTQLIHHNIAPFEVIDYTEKNNPVENTYRLANELDPFAQNWYSHPETEKRLKENLPDGLQYGEGTALFGDSYRKMLLNNKIRSLENLPIFSREFVNQQGITPAEIKAYNLSKDRNTMENTQDYYDSNSKYSYTDGNDGLYSNFSHQIAVDNFNNIGTISHEIAHSDPEWQDHMENAIKRKFPNALNSNEAFRKMYSPNNSFKEAKKNNLEAYKGFQNRKLYLDQDGLYPRIMDIRRVLNLKSGQKVDKSILKDDVIYEKNIISPINDLRHYYDDDTIIKMLNEIASNKTQSPLPDSPQYAAEGGYLPTQGPAKALFKGYAQGGYYATGSRVTEDGEDGKNVVLNPRSVYDSKTGETRNLQVSDDNKTVIDASDPTQTINYFLPEVEISEEAPAWLKSQRENPELYNGSGRAEPSYPEMILLPASLPFKATTALGKVGKLAAEAVNPIGGFKGTPKKLPGFSNVASQQMGVFNTKGALQKYPKGKLTQEEIKAFKNSDYYKQSVQEHLEVKNKYGDSWTLPNYAEEALEEAIATGNRNRINPILYGGRNWGAVDYTIAGLAGTAYPGYAGIMGLAFSPPAVKNKVLNAAGITSKPGVLSSRDTTINITNRPMDFAKVNEIADGQVILGGEFIEGTNNTVRKAKDWLTATDTYSDKEYPSKNIQSFYGIENGKFKVGKASDFNSNTEIVPRRFGATNINKAILNEGALRLLDNQGNPIYQNTPNTGKFILYSPSTKEADFNYINTGKSGVNKVNKFLKKNKDAQYIHLDNGRYEFYGLNSDGLTNQDYRDYYQQDLEREGNPGYNMILKAEGGYMYPDGGKVKPRTYTDLKKFKKAEQAYNDSLGVYNAVQFLNKNIPTSTNALMAGDTYENPIVKKGFSITDKTGIRPKETGRRIPQSYSANPSSPDYYNELYIKKPTPVKYNPPPLPPPIERLNPLKATIVNNIPEETIKGSIEYPPVVMPEGLPYYNAQQNPLYPPDWMVHQEGKWNKYNDTDFNTLRESKELTPYENKFDKGGYIMKNNNQSWRNYLQYATGGTYDEEVYTESPFNDDKRRNTVLNNPSNEGNTYFKPATDWAVNWVSDPEYATRLNENFPDGSKITKVDTLFKSKQEARQDKRDTNLDNFSNYIPTLVNDIKDTKFLYNSNPNTNDQLYRDYSSSYTPEDLVEVNKQLTENPQAFTDPYGIAVVRNRSNDPGQAGDMSAGQHEFWHQGKIPDSKMDMFGNRDYETLDKAYAGKFATPHPSTWSPNSKGVVKSPDKKEFYPMLMQIRMDNGFQPGEIIDDARLNQIRKSGSTNPLFKYYDNEQLKKYLNTFASNVPQSNPQEPYIQRAAEGGYINGRKQYAGAGPVIGGAAGAQAGATAGSVDQDAIMGTVSQAAGYIPVVGQGIQAGMAINNQMAGIGNSIVMSQTPDRYKGFMAEEQKRGKWMDYINPAVGMAYRSIGMKDRLNDFKDEESKKAAVLGTAQFSAANPVEQISLNSPMSADGGYITNNSLNLHNTMTYKRFAQGGTFDQYGINMIPESAGLHHQSAYGGVPIGPNALAEGGEIKMDTGDGGQYIVSDQVDGAETQKDFMFSKGGKYKELNRTLADGMKQDLNKYTMGGLATNPRDRENLRRPYGNTLSNPAIEQIKKKWQEKTEYARQRSQQEQAIAQAEEQKRMAEEQYIAAYGGRINPKKYPGLNMSKKSKGGYVYNPMTQPMLATGGLIYGDPASPYTYAYGGMYGDPYARGGQIDYTNDMYSMYAGGGPMVGNAPQAFKGYAAQNRGGMLMNYADGGMMPQDQQMMQEQQMMQQAPQEQMQQQGGEEQMMQMVQQVMQAIMQGANPEEIMQQLVQSGMPPEQAQQIIQMAMQEAQGQQQQQPMQGQEQMMPQQGMMSSGGKLPREILRARAEAHMSPREAANYVNNYSSGGKMYYEGGKETNDIYTPSYGTQYIEYDEYGNPNSYDSSYGTNIPATPTASIGEFYDQFTNNDLMYDNYLKGAVPNSGPLANNQLTANDKAALAFQEKYSQPGQMTADLIDNTKGNKSNKEGMRGTLSKAPVNTFTQNTSDLTPTVYPDSQLSNNNRNQNTNNSSNLLSGIGIASGLIGPLAHLINNKKPKPFNYVKPTPTTLNSTAALAVARKFANDKYNSAAYTIKQNSPTSQSHLANTLVNTKNAAMNDALAGATIQSGYDRENANIYNTFAQNNAAISNKNIDEMRADKGNYATQNTNAFYNLGANIQGGIRNMNQGRMDDLIANNIGTTNYKLVGNKIIYELNGKTIVKSIDDLQTPTNDFT